MEMVDIQQEKLILAGKRIGVFGKGGSGKSTTVVLLARALRHCGYEVCVIDADSTNIGLPLTLGMPTSPTPLLEYFGGMIFSGGKVTCPVDDPTPLAGSEITLDELPTKYHCQNDQGVHLLVAGKIGSLGAGAGCDGPVSKIARDFKVIDPGGALVTLLDFKAGFEDTARGVITSLDWAVVVIDPTIASIEMAVNMRDMINQIRDGLLPATQHLESVDLVAMANQLFMESKIKGALFLLNRIQNIETEDLLRSKLAERGIQPDGVLWEDPSISAAWLNGVPLDGERSQKAVLALIEKLETAQSYSLVRSD